MIVYLVAEFIKNSREDINDDPQVGQPIFIMNPETAKRVRDFLKIQPKLFFYVREMELEMPRNLIYRIVTDRLRYAKVYAHFVPYKLMNDQKFLRIQHCKDIVKWPKTSVTIVLLVMKHGVLLMSTYCD